MADDEYPSLRKAALGNGHTGNLYCLCKWILWQLFHVIFTALGIVLMVAIVLFVFGVRVVHFLGNLIVKAGAGILSLVPSFDVNPPQPSQPATLQKMGQTMKEKPVTRRIYGECPVNIKQDTRWFSRLAETGMTILETVEPEDTVYVCDECGRKRVTGPAYNSHRSSYCNNGQWEEVPESEA